MASLTSQLVLSLIDRVSGPAKGVGPALKGVAAVEKNLGSGGKSKRFDGLAGSLERAQNAAKGLEFVDLRKLHHLAARKSEAADYLAFRPWTPEEERRRSAELFDETVASWRRR